MHSSPRSARRITHRAFAAAVLLAAIVPAAHAGPATLPTNFTDQQIRAGLAEPVGLARIPDLFWPPEDLPQRVLFIEQRTCRIGLLIGNSESTVGVVPGVSSSDYERGLLGIAVDPHWPIRPYVYVHCTDGRFGHKIAISRFTLTGDPTFASDGTLQLDTASRFDLLRDLPDNASNHNGGTVRFGPDGCLYVSLGDDAGGCTAQDTTVLAGKILRLDVTRIPAGPGGPATRAMLTPPDNPFVAHRDSSARLVWALGLRNPFRFHIDPLTGALFVGDVGENTWEEVDRIGSAGLDIGWPMREGPANFVSCPGASSANLVVPIAYYDHPTGMVVMSAGIYRRPAKGLERFPADYDGDYFYFDYVTGFMRRLDGSGSSWSAAPFAPGQPNSQNWGEGFHHVTDFLEMPDGTLWYCRQLPGEIRRIAYVSPTDAPALAASELWFAAPTPTPSRGRVVLAWSQARGADVSLAIHDLGGRRLRVLERGDARVAGRHEHVWDGRDDSGAPVGPGVYFARLVVGGVERGVRIHLLQ